MGHVPDAIGPLKTCPTLRALNKFCLPVPAVVVYCPHDTAIECYNLNRGCMNWTQIIWDPTPGGNVRHVEEHDLTTDDVDHVLEHYESTGTSRSSGRPCVYGHVPDG